MHYICLVWSYTSLCLRIMLKKHDGIMLKVFIIDQGRLWLVVFLWRVQYRHGTVTDERLQVWQAEKFMYSSIMVIFNQVIKLYIFVPSHLNNHTFCVILFFLSRTFLLLSKNQFSQPSSICYKYSIQHIQTELFWDWESSP